MDVRIWFIRTCELVERIARRSRRDLTFVQQVNRQLTPEAWVQIIEMPWQVADADGVFDAQEDMLLRRIAGLICVPDRERSEARLRVLERLASGKAVPEGAG